jgi:hypothetical protein
MSDLTTSEATNSPADSENVSATTRPSDYLRAHAAIIKTHSDLTAAHGATGAVVGTTNTQTLTNKTINIANNTLTGVQASLVSGTNIKTIGLVSVLGSGDIPVATSFLGLSDTPANYTDAANKLVLVNAAGNALEYFAGQIAFPATQNPSADANTLDDYEEGTFTPVVYGTTAAGAGTYTYQYGTYTKIGRLVTYHIYLSWGAHTGSGNMNVSGLPFTAAESSTVGWFHTGLTLSTGYVLQANVAYSTSTIFLSQITGGSSSAAVPLDTNVSALLLSGSYVVA